MDLEVATCIAFFLLGLVMLVKGGDIFVDGSLWIARKFGISELVIGATVVSIGTTLPELTVSATAAVTGHAGIAYGNAIGSVICNTALIAGLSLLIRPVAVSRKSIANHVIFFFAAAALYTLSAVIFGGIPRMVGALLLTLFVFYCVWTLEHGGESRVQPVEGSMAKEIVLMILGAAAVYLGSRLVVENAEQFAIWMKVPKRWWRSPWWRWVRRCPSWPRRSSPFAKSTAPCPSATSLARICSIWCWSPASPPSWCQRRWTLHR